MPEAERAVRLLSQERGPQATPPFCQLPSRWQDTAPVQGPSGAGGGRSGWRCGRGRSGGQAWRCCAAGPRIRPAGNCSGTWPGASCWMAAGGGPWRFSKPSTPWSCPLPWRPDSGSGSATANGSSASTMLPPPPGEPCGSTIPAAITAGDQRCIWGKGICPCNPGGQEPSNAWHPLASGDGDLDRLWRLDQRTEAWEWWRTGEEAVLPGGTRICWWRGGCARESVTTGQGWVSWRRPRLRLNRSSAICCPAWSKVSIPPGSLPPSSRRPVARNCPWTCCWRSRNRNPVSHQR